jgi:hypothetical protein
LKFPQPFSIYDGILLILLFAPVFKRTRTLGFSSLIAAVLSAVTAAALCAAYVMMFSAPVAATFESGFIEMGKSSYFNHFFYRFESILLFFLIFSSVMYVSLSLLAATESLSRCMNLKSRRGVIYFCTAGVAAVAFIPRGLTELAPHLGFIRNYGLILLAGVPLIMLMVYGARRLFK